MKEIELGYGSVGEMEDLMRVFCKCYSLTGLSIGRAERSPYAGVKLVLIKQNGSHFNSEEYEKYYACSQFYKLGTKHSEAEIVE